MKKLIQALILILCFLVLVVLSFLRLSQDPIEAEPSAVPALSEATQDDAQMPVAAPVSSETAQEPVATPEPTPEPTPTPTPEPTPELFKISVIGDETLTTHQNLSDESEYSYAGRMQGDYSYPFKNTAEYFKNDEFTIFNF